MTLTGLITGLAEDLREATANFIFPAQYQEPKKVSVYAQTIPTADFENQSFYPLICVELLGVEDAAESAAAAVLLTLGTYSGEGDAWQDHLNLLEQVRRYLLQHRIIRRGYVLKYPLEIGLVEPRSDNFTFSNIFATYEIQQPVTGLPAEWEKI